MTVANPLWRYYDVIQNGLALIGRERGGGSGFRPDHQLPDPSAALQRFFAASPLRLGSMGRYRGSRLTLLDLMGNPRTRTTKTFASLVIVARMARHVRESGRPGVILTPSSGNKASALRDAVLRACEHGLAAAGELRIVAVVPDAARPKLWSSPLDADPLLSARNPVAVVGEEDRARVEELALAASERCAAELRGADLWYSLDLGNYLAGDAVRALFEQEVSPPGPDCRLHVHAVSSAYGLLGHSFGRRLAGATGPAPRYLLVQHLETPDMVLSLCHGSTSRERLPRYRRESGLYRQTDDPRVPATTFDVDECLDPTFYTRRPPTSPEMNRLIRDQGGGGIVVSPHECLQRYAEVGELVAAAGVDLPRDPRRLREWSLVMAVTGVLNAIDRGLVAGEDVLVHGSGSYADEDFTPMSAGRLCRAADVDDVCRLVLGAAA
jgi:hypothetical protein